VKGAGVTEDVSILIDPVRCPHAARVKGAGVTEDVSIHSLRHSFATFY